MPDYRTMYDRDYIGHFDLPGGNDMTLTMKRVIGGELTAMGGRKSKKPIVHFAEAVKPLICNKTNAKTIASMYGNLTEQWAGKRITLFVSTTRDPGGSGEVECIRVRPKIPNAAVRTPVAAEPRDLAEIDETATAAPSTAPAPATPQPSSVASPLAEPEAGATYISADALREIEATVEQKGIKGRFSAKLAASGISSPDKIPSGKVKAIRDWVDAAREAV